MTTPTRPCDVCHTPMPAGALHCPSCGAPSPTEIGATLPDPGVHPRSTGDFDLRRAQLQGALGEGFEVRRLVGRGGFGEVWEAFDVYLSRKVAVKVMRTELVSSPELRERFRREARAVAQLRHPNIVPIYHVGEGQGLVYFIMPLVEGVTLKAALDQAGPMTVGEAVRILSEAASALQAAHARGIVHRDLKPENFMLEGQERRVLLMDFGIAQSEESVDKEITGAGVVLGSPEYMSPEQATGSRRLDARSDIYSLGVVAYRMLAGRLPFDAATARELLVHHITTPPEPLLHHATVPPALSEAVMRCLAKTPEERWQSTEQFRGALHSGETEAVPAPEGAAAGGRRASGTPAAPPSRRRRVVRTGLTTLAAAAVLAAIGLVPLRRWQRRQAWTLAAGQIAVAYRAGADSLQDLASAFASGDSTGAQSLLAQELLLAGTEVDIDQRYGPAIDDSSAWPEQLRADVGNAARRFRTAGLAIAREALLPSDVAGCRVQPTPTQVVLEDAAPRANCWFRSANTVRLGAPAEYLLDFRITARLPRDGGIGLAWCRSDGACRVIFLWPGNEVEWASHEPRAGLRELQLGRRLRLPVGGHRLRVRYQDGALRAWVDGALVLERQAGLESDFLETPGSIHVVVQNAPVSLVGAEPVGIVGMRRSGVRDLPVRPPHQG